MTKTQILVVGQGLAGTWLSYFLEQAGIDFLMMDAAVEGSSSRVASGVINPVTGRQVHTTWMAETLIPLAQKQYAAIETLLGQPILLGTQIEAFPPSAEMRMAYEQRATEANGFVGLEDHAAYHNFFEYRHGTVQIKPALLLDVPALLTSYKARLQARNQWIDAQFHEALLQINEDAFVYDERIVASQVILAQGAAAAAGSLFGWVPFSLNKGEALILDIKALPRNRIYKFGITTLVPWTNDLWWMGSVYDNRFAHHMPTPEFAQRMQAAAAQILKVPFVVKDHISGIRPASIDRRPFVGEHPLHKNLYLFNGLGTKGCSLAPWAAEKLVQHMLAKQALPAEISLKRFERLFNRQRMQDF